MVADDFGGEVFRSAAEGIGDASAVAVGSGFTGSPEVSVGWGWRKAFGKSEINQFQMSISVEENVFGFQVAVGDVDMVVKVGNDKSDLGGVELNGREGESSSAPEVGKYLAAGRVLELDWDELA